MEKNKVFQTFKKNHLFIITKDNEKTDVPDFVSKSISTYRFDAEKLELQKSCYMCRRWFPVAKLNNDEWIDVHDEKDMHLVPSGYGTYCVSCIKSKENKSDSDLNKKVFKGEKYSILLLETHRKYIKIRATIQDKTITNVMEDIINNEMERNPLNRLI